MKRTFDERKEDSKDSVQRQKKHDQKIEESIIRKVLKYVNK